MNLGVETRTGGAGRHRLGSVSAFSDESWGGDPNNRAAWTMPTQCFSIL